MSAPAHPVETGALVGEIASRIQPHLALTRNTQQQVRAFDRHVIVRQTDEQGQVTSVGISLEPVAPVTRLPLFLSLREIIQTVRDNARKRRG